MSRRALAFSLAGLFVALQLVSVFGPAVDYPVGNVLFIAYFVLPLAAGFAAQSSWVLSLWLVTPVAIVATDRSVPLGDLPMGLVEYAVLLGAPLAIGWAVGSGWRNTPSRNGPVPG